MYNTDASDSEDDLPTIFKRKSNSPTNIDENAEVEYEKLQGAEQKSEVVTKLKSKEPDKANINRNINDGITKFKSAEQRSQIVSKIGNKEPEKEIVQKNIEEDTANVKSQLHYTIENKGKEKKSKQELEDPTSSDLEEDVSSSFMQFLKCQKDFVLQFTNDVKGTQEIYLISERLKALERQTSLKKYAYNAEKENDIFISNN